MTRKVLVLDDNADNRKLLYYALMTGDFEIYEAELGSEANALLEKREFDLALLDVELPDADGLELAGLLHQKYPDMFLIMLSANDDTTLLTRAREAGAQAYVVKPFNLRKLLDLITQSAHQPAGEPHEMVVI